MTVLQAINKIRPLINDKQAVRWTDDRIIDVLNEAQRNIVKNTKIHIKTTNPGISLVAGQAEYTLPTDLLSLIRVTFEDKVIPFQSYDFMDAQYEGRKWELDRGPNLKYVLTNKSNWNKIRLYPIPAEFTSVDLTGDTTEGGPYGALTLYISDDGDINGTIDGKIYVTYQRRPIDVTNTGGAGAYTDVIDIEDIYLDAVVYYSASILLLDSDNPTVLQKSVAFGNMYRGELGLLQDQKTGNFTETQAREIAFRSL